MKTEKRDPLENDDGEIEFWVPWYASVKGTLEKPDNWNKLSVEEKADLFLSNAHFDRSVCHQCSNVVNLDGDMVDGAEKNFIDEWKFADKIQKSKKLEEAMKKKGE